MNKQLLYQWREQISKHLGSLNAWQKENVAVFSLGMIEAKSSQQRQIAEHLSEVGEAESVKRRLQRFLANDKIEMDAFFKEWTQWVAGGWEQASYTLLVDETKLGERLGVMMVALAYQGRAIPLAWACYKANDSAAYPAEGQVEMIKHLLQVVKTGLPAGCSVTVQADRGIGTSPKLAQVVVDEQWYFLFRVTAQTKIVTSEGDLTIFQQVQVGQQWRKEGKVFKKRGKIAGYACALWEEGYDQPLALVTNHPTYTGHEYAQRNWQEQAFRDLKSSGWQWDKSHVWHPAHAQRLLILMVVAYGWMLALGVQATLKGQALVKRLPNGQVARQLSLFQQGLRLFRRLRLDPFAIFPGLWFPFDPLFP